MARIHFDANGWRARRDAGYDEDVVARIAYGLGSVWAERSEGFTILVGFDGRRHARKMAEVVAQVLAHCGMYPVVASRPCSTPALGWSCAREPRCAGGVILTASRMPREYAGILVRQADGGPVDEEFAERVEQRIPRSVTWETCELEQRDFVAAYLDGLVWGCDQQLVEQAELKVVVDPLYGACAGVATELLSRVGCEVVGLHDEAAPDFRGMHPDPREPWVDECERLVRSTKAHLGIVIDGDGDRCAIVDERGCLVSPYDLALLVLDHLVRQRGMRGRIVATAATSVRVARYARQHGCPTTMVPVGVNPLYRELQDGDVLLTIDERGGVCIPSHLKERDALAAALMIIELTSGSQLSISEQIADIEAHLGTLEYGTRQIRLDAGLAQRTANILPGVNPRLVAGSQPVRVSHADGVRLSFDDDSWLLMRVARTEPVVRLYAEAPTGQRLEALLAAAQGALSNSLVEEVWS